jgi:prepilin-type N-terminal cleavage/methylation domain-containing protein
MWPMRCSDPSRMRRSNAHRRRGFTLIEMMVVVALVGVMAAIAGANLRGQQTRSRFRSSVRELNGLIREARSNAVSLAGASTLPNAIINNNCPASMVATPGVNINATTGVVTVLERVRVAARVDGGGNPTGLCQASGRCAISSSSCLGDADCPPFPEYTIFCRQENFRDIYRNEVAFVPAPSVASLTNAGATDLRIGFDGRGRLTTRIGGQVGRLTLREDKGGASELQLSVIVNDGGVACVEGVADQCARLQ